LTPAPDSYHTVKREIGDATLKFVQDSIEVHRVQAVQYKVQSHKVLIYQPDKHSTREDRS
jgi:hypothetical protein